MKIIHRLLQSLLAVALLFSGLGSFATPAPAASLHPLLARLAVAQPHTNVAVIVQRADTSDAAQHWVARLGGRVTRDLSIINAFSARMTAGAARDLAASGTVRWVSPDGEVAGSSQSESGQALEDTPSNYYLDTTGARQVWQLGLTGKGIGVAVIDTGIATDNDFGNRLVKRVRINPLASNANDIYGHGTHVAGIIAGSGADSGGLYSGIAPGANLLSLRVSDDAGKATESDVVAAMQWVLDNKTKFNIRVVNLSINSSVEQSYHNSPLSAAAEILWFNKIVVVASAGNRTWKQGYNPVNTAPANDPFVITVGASMETGSWLKAFGDWATDYEAPFSAHGVTADGYTKPDIVAPGTSVISVLAPKSPWVTEQDHRLVANGQYIWLSGTSMSTPMVTGAVALLLQDEPNLTPDQVKYRLTHAARSVQGWDGQKEVTYPYLDVYAAVTGTTTESANEGLPINRLLFTGSNPMQWSAVNWTAVNWTAVNWTAVNWTAVNWAAVNWAAVNWAGVSWDD
jgi:serine protease AprX